ncbi:MAG: undecaprenyldiphospho-muramoylpentapeptide beta-N-acetylglucosaminyltransferase, partial [Plesiomonas shigelloides]
GLTLEKAGAAYIIEQDQLTAERLEAQLLLLNRPQLLAMAQHARAAAIPDATDRVAAVIQALADKRT